MMKHRLVLYLSCILILKCKGWIRCDNGGICPNGNTCCPTNVSGVATCISGQFEAGECCSDTFSSTPWMVTGCGDNFTCAIDQDTRALICANEHPDQSDDPPKLPRYKLCSLPDRVLQQVYGFPVLRENATASQLAYLSSMGPLDSKDPVDLNIHLKVETIVIMIHGSSRNVDDYICSTVAALPEDASKIMVVAPWFLVPEDGNVTLTGKTDIAPLRWELKGPIEHTWRYGADSLLWNTSSYTAIDSIIDFLANDLVRFPALKRVVVAGHSAGGQFVQRWALLSNNNIFSTSSRLVVRVVVANPKSLCYLDERRWSADGSFTVPDDDTIRSCPQYNEWEWGLSEGRDFLPTPYKDNAIHQAGGVQAIVDRYPSRDIVYLAGELDILPNGDCWDKIQGDYRRIRSERYMKALEEIYGRPIHRRIVVRGVNHNHALMFQSAEGRQAIFERNLLERDDVD